MKFNSRPTTAQSYDLAFMAQITDVATGKTGGFFDGQYVYSWIEQTYTYNTGKPVNVGSPRRGSYNASTDVAAQPALEPNNRKIEPGTYVYLQVKGFVADVLVFEILDFAPVRFVKVTGTTTTDGWYPGILQEWNPDTQAWFEPQRWDVTTQALVSGTCWVRGANDESLTIGHRYGSEYAGQFEAVQSYVTLGGATEESSSGSDCLNCTKMVTDVSCVDGMVTETFKYVRVRGGKLCISDVPC